MGNEFNIEGKEEDAIVFEPRKLDEKDFSKKLNQSKLGKHEMDELFLLDE